MKMRLNTDAATDLRINTLLAILLILMSVMSWQLITQLRTQQRIVQDLAELRHVKYGMLNVDKWVQQLTVIVDLKIRQQEFTGEQREAMKATLERLLYALITEADQYIKSQEANGGWWQRTKDKFKDRVRDALLDMDTIKAGIPDYAEQILLELEKPDTREEINKFLNALINDFSRETFGELDKTLKELIQLRYDCSGETHCKSVITAQLVSIEKSSHFHAGLILLCALLMLLLVQRNVGVDNRLKWIFLASGAMLLLLCGILTPMIVVEAQISELSFSLLGQPIRFFNEVLYFQSKSILDVVSILTATGKVDMVLVGILLTTFSIIFPVLKLVASVLFVYNPRELRNSPLVEFFALKSGKWSMADVMVIAIMMAFIGFNGIIGSQLDLITQGAAGAGVDVLTTNGTSLQLGFYMFLAFCLFSLLVSTMMESAFKSQRPCD